jgi:hypothetical protein
MMCVPNFFLARDIPPRVPSGTVFDRKHNFDF